MWLFRTGLKIPTHQNFPPGYVSPQSYGNMLEGQSFFRHKMKRLLQLSLRRAFGRTIYHRGLCRDRR